MMKDRCQIETPWPPILFRNRQSKEKHLRIEKSLLMIVVASLYLAACLLPGFWARGGFFEGGDEVGGWYLVLGFPPSCMLSWPSIVAMLLSAAWLWQGRYRRAFFLGCLNILPGAYWLGMEKPGRFELRIGYYVWLAALVVWPLGVGGLLALDRRNAVPPIERKDRTG
jgi:hypothetical protein